LVLIFGATDQFCSVLPKLADKHSGVQTTFTVDFQAQQNQDL